MIGGRSTQGYFTFCLDQILILSDEISEKFPSLAIVIDSLDCYSNYFDLFQIGEPYQLDIKLKFPFKQGDISQVVIYIYLEQEFFLRFEFLFIENILTSMQKFKYDDHTFTRILIRAYTDNTQKFKIGPLYEFDASDFVESSMREIGRGSFGFVYYAEEKLTREKRALKILRHPDILDPCDSSIREVLPFISIPHQEAMLKIFGYFFDTRMNLILVLEFIPSGSLEDYMFLNNSIRSSQLFKIIQSISNGLNHIHKYGLIHRDISPDNILLTEEFECIIIDFSISRFSSGLKTQNQGKPKYMAPEVRASGTYDRKADIYSGSKIILDLIEMLDKDEYEEYWNVCKIIFKHNIEEDTDYYDRSGLTEISLVIPHIENYIDVSSDTKLYSFIEYLINLSFPNYLQILCFASELAKVLDLNEPNFSNLFWIIMLIGGIALDLEICRKDLYMPFNKYDTNRLFYYLNMKNNIWEFCSYEDNFLEFDERVGFRPTKKHIDCDQVNFAKLTILALEYHLKNISRIENEANNPVIDQIVSILDCDYIDESFKVYVCLSYYLKYGDDFSLEFHSTIYGALADAGYDCFVIIALLYYLNLSHGRKKALKYFKMLIEIDDTFKQIDYLEFINILEDEEKYQKKFWNRMLIDSFLKSDIQSAFYSQVMILSIGHEIKSSDLTFELYNISVAMVYYVLSKNIELIRVLNFYFGLGFPENAPLAELEKSLFDLFNRQNSEEKLLLVYLMRSFIFKIKYIASEMNTRVETRGMEKFKAENL